MIRLIIDKELIIFIEMIISALCIDIIQGSTSFGWEGSRSGRIEGDSIAKVKSPAIKNNKV